MANPKVANTACWKRHCGHWKSVLIAHDAIAFNLATLIAKQAGDGVAPQKPTIPLLAHFEIKGAEVVGLHGGGAHVEQDVAGGWLSQRIDLKGHRIGSVPAINGNRLVRPIKRIIGATDGRWNETQQEEHQAKQGLWAKRQTHG